MNTIRFTLLALGLFTLTFAGISWASSRTMLAGDPVSACATGRRADSQR